MDLLKKPVRVAKYLWKRVTLWPYYFWITRDAVWQKNNRTLLESYQKHGAQFTELQKKILNGLETEGIYITHIDELIPGTNFLHEMQALSETLINPEGKGKKKEFLNYFYEEKNAKDLNAPFLRFALSEPVLETVSAYLKMFARLRFFSTNITRPVDAGSDAAGSQRWHRDPGIKRICKVFFYVNDVLDISAGPFVYVKGSQPGGKYGHLFKQILFGMEGYYPPEGAVERAVDSADITPCTGRAGTIIFCNTTGLHKGGYSTAKERIMFTAFYKHSLTNIPPAKKYPENFEANFARLGKLGKLAIESKGF